jgi:hypothetical protein
VSSTQNGNGESGFAILSLGARAGPATVRPVRIRQFLLGGVLVNGLATCSNRPTEPGNASPAADIPADSFKIGAARASARIFISGHSLVDQPLPTLLADVAQQAGTPVEWNRQYVVGSSIRRRVQGADPTSKVWAGYHEGDNREGSGLDVLAELQRPATITGGLYDVLLITEQHGLLETLVYNDTVRYLRHYHDHFIGANPSGVTFFYESWLGIQDKGAPERWIAHERMASPIWQCIATRVNVALQAQGRPDRIVSLPAGAALAELVERATRGPGLPAITRGSVRETVDSLVADDVHLTPLGSYYMALVTYAAIFQLPPPVGRQPDGVSSDQARELQRVAAAFVANYYANYSPLSLADCRARIVSGVNYAYWSYVEDTSWRRQEGALRATIKKLRRWATWQWIFTRQNSTNPFFFDAAADKTYWFPK